MARHVDTLPRVRLAPADWEQVQAMAERESRSVANLLGVLIREALMAREAATAPQGLGESHPAITRPEPAQKGGTR